MDIQNYGDRHKLQKDINLHIKWPEKNNIELNKKRFQLLQYGSNN